MTITVGCPNCGKKYSLNEKLMGKKAKCACGHVFRIGKAGQTLEKKDKSQSSDAFDAQSKEGSGRKNPSEPINRELLTEQRHISTQRSMAKEILIHLAYGFPGLIIVAILVCCKSGFLPALLVMVFGAIAFCIVMYKGISVHRERAAESGMTYKQYQRQWRGPKTTSPRLKFAQGVVYLSCILLLGRLIIPDEWAEKVLPNFAFAEHWKMYLLILVLNLPVLLFLAVLMMGNWKKYLRITVRLFLWERLPFHYFFKGFWRTFAEMSREELFGWAATNMLYIWICLLEYLVIKSVFFN